MIMSPRSQVMAWLMIEMNLERWRIMSRICALVAQNCHRWTRGAQPGFGQGQLCLQVGPATAEGVETLGPPPLLVHLLRDRRSVTSLAHVQPERLRALPLASPCGFARHHPAKLASYSTRVVPRVDDGLSIPMRLEDRLKNNKGCGT